VNAAEVPTTRRRDRAKLGAILRRCRAHGDHHGDHDGDHDSEASALAIRAAAAVWRMPARRSRRRAADRAASAISADDAVVLDEAAIANLELTETLMASASRVAASM